MTATPAAPASTQAAAFAAAMPPCARTGRGPAQARRARTRPRAGRVGRLRERREDRGELGVVHGLRGEHFGDGVGRDTDEAPGRSRRRATSGDMASKPRCDAVGARGEGDVEPAVHEQRAAAGSAPQRAPPRPRRRRARAAPRRRAHARAPGRGRRRRAPRPPPAPARTRRGSPIDHEAEEGAGGAQKLASPSSGLDALA